MVVAKNGFSLIEVLIVVVIVGVIVAIAIPSYTQYVIKAKRIDAQSELLTIASRIQRYKIINNSLENSTVVLTDNFYNLYKNYFSIGVEYDYYEKIKKDFHLVFDNKNKKDEKILDFRQLEKDYIYALMGYRYNLIYISKNIKRQWLSHCSFWQIGSDHG